ncbi:sensor histidine kinase [Geomonas sp.]|uniref:sensor histidine kinase n=1 Tax=Geomonas sp. TaxID=2651584 RepID=UPI002B45B574|nr:response regulator [Geomonas sp.]HJV33751.1 response regulator [Geomonas sp.]
MVAHRPTYEGSTLLYVEDEQITRETVCTVLGRRFPGLAIHSTENGAAGFKLFQELSPDLVLTDIKMPVMSGIEMARGILALDPGVPIIVTTAHSDTDYLIESIEIGISRYLIKPVETDKLFSAIEECLEALTLQKELKAQQAFVRKLSRAVEQSGSGIVIADRQGTVEYVNPRFSELTGYPAGELIGASLWTLRQLGELPAGLIESAAEWRGELEGVKKGGEPYTGAVSLSPLWDELGELTNFVAVTDDITLRKQSEHEIALLNERLEARAHDLEKVNRDLESFSYTVSHDLRSPLTKISGFCQLMQELYGELLDEQGRSFIDIIDSEALAMNRLINTLLEFSRLSRSELVRQRTDLSEIAAEIAGELRMREPQRRISFRIPEGVEAEGDPDLLRVVLDNLLGNACKYTGKKEEALIEFGVDEQGGESAYFVRDNGAGFDMAYSDKLFGAFQRLHSDAEFAGLGIGLATVARIIQRHGGRVWAVGEPGEGATFYFTLPPAPPQDAEGTKLA